jgi:hypothetical protein
MRIVATGGPDLIGRAVCRRIVLNEGWGVLNVDKLTYGANARSLNAVRVRALVPVVTRGLRMAFHWYVATRLVLRPLRDGVYGGETSGLRMPNRECRAKSL